MQIRAAVILCLFLILRLNADPLKESRTFNVLIIHSYAPGSWNTEAVQGVRNAFHDRNISLNLREHVYDYYAYQQLPSYQKNLRKKAVEKVVAEQKPALIFIFDDEAADDLLQRLNKLKIPIVLGGINKKREHVKWWLSDGDTKRYFTGVWERYPFYDSLKMLHRINPKIEEISLLTGANQSARIITEQLVAFFNSNAGAPFGIKLNKVFMSSEWTEWKKAIKSYTGKNKAFWIVSPWNINDSNGKEVDLRVMAKYYHQHSNLPTLSIASVNQQLGFLASFAVSSEDMAYQCAEMGLRVLIDGKPPNTIPFEDLKNVRFVINKARAESLGYRIPLELLEFAEIEKKIPMKFVR